MNDPHGSLTLATDTGPAALTISNVPARLNIFTANGQGSSFDFGDESIQPNYQQNQIQVYSSAALGQARYRIDFTATVQVDGCGRIDFFLYQNGNLVPDIGCASNYFEQSNPQTVSFLGIYLADRANAPAGTVLLNLEVWASNRLPDPLGNVGATAYTDPGDSGNLDIQVNSACFLVTRLS